MALVTFSDTTVGGHAGAILAARGGAAGSNPSGTYNTGGLLLESLLIERQKAHWGLDGRSVSCHQEKTPAITNTGRGTPSKKAACIPEAEIHTTVRNRWQEWFPYCTRGICPLLCGHVRRRMKRPNNTNSMAEGYCVKCKAKREIANAVEETMKNGRKAIKGKCPTCGTVMFKILGGKATPPTPPAAPAAPAAPTP